MYSVIGAVLSYAAAGGGDQPSDAGSTGNASITVIGSIVVAFIGLATAYLGKRASNQQKRLEARNEAARREIEQGRLRVEERKQRDEYYDQLTENMQKRIEQLTTDNNTVQRRVEGLQASIEAMNVERAKDRTVIDRLVTYCRQLVSMLRDADLDPPATPEELSAYSIDRIQGN